MKIVIGSDHMALDLKKSIIDHLTGKGQVILLKEAAIKKGWICLTKYKAERN